MNDRIREVWIKAAREDSDPDNWDTQEQFIERFAQLIVKECTNLLFDESERLYAYSSECDNMRESDEAELVAEKCVDLITMIEEHFGVEEVLLE